MRNFRQAWTESSFASMSKISKVSSQAWRKLSLAFFSFQNSSQCKIRNVFRKIPHNVGFSVRLTLPHNVGLSVRLTLPHNAAKLIFLYSIVEKQSYCSFQNSSQCRIAKVFQKFPTMLEHFYWHHLQHFFNCWRWCQMKNSSQCWIFTRRNQKVFEKFLTMLDSSR